MKQLPPSGAQAQPIHGPTLVAIPQWSTELSTSSLSAEDRTNLAQISTIVHFRRGDIIHTDDRVNAIFSVITGVAKSFNNLENGDVHVTGFFFQDDFIGMMAERGMFTESASAITEVSAYKIPVPALERVIQSNPSLSLQIMTKIFHHMRDIQRHAYLLNKKSARAKVGFFLKMMLIQQAIRERRSHDVFLPMARTDIASYIGISPEAVSRALRDLAMMGAIAFRDRHHAVITNSVVLDQVAADLRPPRR